MELADERRIHVCTLFPTRSIRSTSRSPRTISSARRMRCRRSVRRRSSGARSPISAEVLDARVTCRVRWRSGVAAHRDSCLLHRAPAPRRAPALAPHRRAAAHGHREPLPVTASPRDDARPRGRRECRCRGSPGGPEVRRAARVPDEAGVKSYDAVIHGAGPTERLRPGRARTGGLLTVVIEAYDTRAAGCERRR